jgi:hypothetical protein
MKYLKIFESFDTQGHLNDLSSDLEEEFSNLVCKVDKDSIWIGDRNDHFLDGNVIELLVHRLDLLQDKCIDLKLTFNCYYALSGYDVFGDPPTKFIVYYGLDSFIKKLKDKKFVSILIIL